MRRYKITGKDLERKGLVVPGPSWPAGPQKVGKLTWTTWYGTQTPSYKLKRTGLSLIQKLALRSLAGPDDPELVKEFRGKIDGVDDLLSIYPEYELYDGAGGVICRSYRVSSGYMVEFAMPIPTMKVIIDMNEEEMKKWVIAQYLAWCVTAGEIPCTPHPLAKKITLQVDGMSEVTGIFPINPLAPAEEPIENEMLWNFSRK